MTQASAARVEKLVNKKKAHANRSFDQLVSDTTLARLKPYVQSQVMQASQQIIQSVYQAMMSERAMMQTRQLAFERLLTQNCPWFNEQVLAMAVAEVEDESAGYSSVDDEAKPGDKVRLEFQAKHLDQGEWSSSNKLAVNSLLAKNADGNVQTASEAFEQNLVGMKVGETKEFLLPETVKEGEEPENTRLKVTIMRISRAVPKAEPQGGADVQG